MNGPHLLPDDRRYDFEVLFVYGTARFSYLQMAKTDAEIDEFVDRYAGNADRIRVMRIRRVAAYALRPNGAPGSQ